MTTPEVSHGRGGAGNINPDDTKYVDGEIVRQGEEGSHGDGAFSTGRGGAANIADAAHPPSTIGRLDREIVPEEATRPSTDNESFHVGRGGAANVHLSAQDREEKQQKKAEKHDKHTSTKVVDSPSAPGAAPTQGLADKLKHKIFGVFKK
ncbi:uncharacterized protein F4822DRAFT_400873 [Hypoxylon trugodes]|uniref:uncharacterized protein n=1 Tax=Hypoxylon trugodes TaxID=326681 RepID=UPI002199D03A|nr:uncharacterized protein F4822DRAFT_400873 [Hypoxylon trugodes]KAI1390095.1 hypothetical protein F4822DRAFT_400873 [Hypoxylon trugodes]